jgi:hypothetical protein
VVVILNKELLQQAGFLYAPFVSTALSAALQYKAASHYGRNEQNEFL